jgi:hypothetical protein
MSKKVAEVLVETLQAAGVKRCVIGMAVHTAKAVLQGKGHDVWEMVTDNIE